MENVISRLMIGVGCKPPPTWEEDITSSIKSWRAEFQFLVNKIMNINMKAAGCYPENYQGGNAIAYITNSPFLSTLDCGVQWKLITDENYEPCE